MAVPDRFDTVRAVNAAHPMLIKTNTRATVTEFLWRVVWALAQTDSRWGFLSKLPAENGVDIPGAGKVAIDAIAYEGEHNVVDIIKAAGDGPGTGGIGWGETDERRASSVWVKAVPFPGSDPVEPLPPRLPDPPSGSTSDLLRRIGEAEQKLKDLADKVSAAELDARDARQVAVMLAERVASLRLQAAPELPDDQAISTNSVWGHAHRIKARIV